MQRYRLRLWIRDGKSYSMYRENCDFMIPPQEEGGDRVAKKARQQRVGRVSKSAHQRCRQQPLKEGAELRKSWRNM